jgi:hypothetical protein
MGALLVGSCASGKATYRSDVDVLVILKAAPLIYSRICALRDRFDQAWQKTGPLDCHLNFVLTNVFETSDPAMKHALHGAVTLTCHGGAELNKRLAAFRRRK